MKGQTDNQTDLTEFITKVQECIPVGCVPSTTVATGGLHPTPTPQTETPLDRDSHKQRPPRPLETPQTDTPCSETPGQKPPGQRQP